MRWGRRLFRRLVFRAIDTPNAIKPATALMKTSPQSMPRMAKLLTGPELPGFEEKGG